MGRDGQNKLRGDDMDAEWYEDTELDKGEDE
jgi:hypothetical protein